MKNSLKIMLISFFMAGLVLPITALSPQQSFLSSMNRLKKELAQFKECIASRGKNCDPQRKKIYKTIAIITSILAAIAVSATAAYLYKKKQTDRQKPSYGIGQKKEQQKSFPIVIPTKPDEEQKKEELSDVQKPSETETSIFSESERKLGKQLKIDNKWTKLVEKYLPSLMQASYSQAELSKVDRFRNQESFLKQASFWTIKFIPDNNNIYRLWIESGMVYREYRSPTVISVSSSPLSQYDPTMDGDYGNISYIGALLWDNTKSNEDKYKDVINALSTQRQQSLPSLDAKLIMLEMQKEQKRNKPLYAKRAAFLAWKRKQIEKAKEKQQEKGLGDLPLEILEKEIFQYVE